MDEHARETFRLRFIKLTLLLNAFVLLIAIGAFVLIIFHTPTGIAAGLGLLAAGVIVFLYTWHFYQETKEWLEANAGTGEEKH
jgi:multisubunit Na+/H+ antiporter MnhC subunit